MAKKTLSKDGKGLLIAAFKDTRKLEWVALDAFRIWYSEMTEEGMSMGYKEFKIEEIGANGTQIRRI